MNHQPNKKAIGLFFIIGIGILVLVLGQAVFKRLWNKDTYMAVMYFEESTQGLNVGSPVVFNGVELGKVEKISLEADPKTFNFKVPVYVKLKPINLTENQDSWRHLLDHRGRTLHRLIEMGLRAKLRSQSYLTGQLMIELDIEKDAPLNMVNPWKAEDNPDIPEIPTVLSATERLSKGLEEMEFQTTFDKVNTILTTLDRQLPQLLEAITKSAENMEKITHMVSTDTVDRANRTLTEISETMRSVRNLTDYLEQYPESLLKGKK